MSGLLIADTVSLGTGASAPTELLAALSTYLELVQQRSLHSLLLPDDLAQVDWGKIWQDYTHLLKKASGETVAIAASGSLGDAIDDHSTLASLCQDWRLSVLLTLPDLPYAVSLAAAFSALATSAKTPLVGFVLVGGEGTDSQAEYISVLSQQIEAIARVPVLGHLSLNEESQGEPADNDSAERNRTLVDAAARLNWELLPW